MQDLEQAEVRMICYCGNSEQVIIEVKRGEPAMDFQVESCRYCCNQSGYLYDQTSATRYP